MKKFSVLFMASGRNMGLTFNLSRLAIALKEIGHKVVTVSELGEEEKGLAEELKRKGIAHYTFYGLDALSLKNTVKAARTIGKIADYENVDVVHVQGMRQLIVAFLASRIFSPGKKVAIVASTHSILAGTPYEKATLFIESLLLNLCADLAMPVSKLLANRLIDCGLIRNKVVVVYNGIDSKLVEETLCKDHDDRSLLLGKVKFSSDILIGYFARLVPNKGHEYLIDAISKVSKDHPNVKLLIGGDGPLKHELKSLSKQLGVEEKVVFVGKIEHKTVYKLLKRVDIYVFPSSAELFPYAILEAMAAGKPIVSTHIGGVPEIIKNGETGFLVPPKDQDKLADGIRKLIEKPKEAEQMGRNGRKLIEEKFTLGKIADDLTKCYEISIRRKHR